MASQVVEFNADGTGESNNSADVTVPAALAAYPDLVVANLAVDAPFPLLSGNSVTVRWQDANTGTSATTGSWSDYLTVTNTTTGKGLATIPIAYDAAAAGNGAIAAGDARDRQYTYAANLSWIKRAHSIRFGVDLIKHEMNHWQPESGGWSPRGGQPGFSAAVCVRECGALPVSGALGHGEVKEVANPLHEFLCAPIQETGK